MSAMVFAQAHSMSNRTDLICSFTIKTALPFAWTMIPMRLKNGNYCPVVNNSASCPPAAGAFPVAERLNPLPTKDKQFDIDLKQWPQGAERVLLLLFHKSTGAIAAPGVGRGAAIMATPASQTDSAAKTEVFDDQEAEELLSYTREAIDHYFAENGPLGIPDGTAGLLEQ